MQILTSTKKRGRKLTPAQRQQVTSLILAGASNAAICQKLRDDGHEVELTRQALWYLRTKPQVKEVPQQEDAAATQIGLGLRAHRVALLNTLVAENLQRIKEGMPEREEVQSEVAPGVYEKVERERRRPLRVTEVVQLQKVILQCLREISVLVGDASAPPLRAALDAASARSEREAALKQAARGCGVAEKRLASTLESRRG